MFRATENSLYREGVVTDRPAKEGHSFVNIGLKGTMPFSEAICIMRWLGSGFWPNFGSKALKKGRFLFKFN